MKHQSAGLIVVLLLGAGLVQEQDDPGKVITSLNLLIGRPEVESGETNGTLLVSGTVIPVETGTEEEPGSLNLYVPRDIPDKLQKALRLERLNVRYALLKSLAVGERTELQRPSKDSTLQLYTTLLGFNQDIATYRVEVLDGRQILSDSNVGVRMGKRAVVGALDGEEAPYLFLVLGPQSTGELPLPSEALKPRLVETVIAEYPPEAKDQKIEGVVIVRGLIREDGTPANLSVVDSPSEILSRAALDAVSKWRYQAARDSHGDPIAVEYTVTLKFALR